MAKKKTFTPTVCGFVLVKHGSSDRGQVAVVRGIDNQILTVQKWVPTRGGGKGGVWRGTTTIPLWRILGPVAPDDARLEAAREALGKIAEAAQASGVVS